MMELFDMGKYDFFVACYDEHGSLDTDFGGSGNDGLIRFAEQGPLERLRGNNNRARGIILPFHSQLLGRTQGQRGDR